MRGQGGPADGKEDLCPHEVSGDPSQWGGGPGALAPLHWSCSGSLGAVAEDGAEEEPLKHPEAPGGDLLWARPE